MASRRSPGGGRKPTGPFAKKDATLSTRVTTELLDALKAEAKRSRRALSQEVELRLRGSLHAPADQSWGAPHVLRLAELVSMVTRSVETGMGANPFDEKPSEFAWHKNADTHAAVSKAIEVILTRFKPAQKGPPSKVLADKAAWLEQQFGREFAQREGTAEALGISCALGLLDQMAWLHSPPSDKPDNAHYSDLHYRLPRIREDLK